MNIDYTAVSESVRSAVADIAQGAALTRENIEAYALLLEEFECWAPLLNLVNNTLKQPVLRNKHDFIRLARIHCQKLEDPEATAQVCGQLVAEFKLHYDQLREEVLQVVVEPEDWATEISILQTSLESFPDNADRVACLERLSLIYEKKMPNDQKLEESYLKLLSIDPTNLKALRYFKLAFTQAYEWEEVVRILGTLLKSNAHPIDLFRFAQELAAVHLYQLDRPAEAVRVLESFCLNSPLDTSTIHFDAYQRLGDLAGCIKVLKYSLKNENSQKKRAVLHYKIGELSKQLKLPEEATQQFQTVLQLYPGLLDAAEKIVEIGVMSKNWPLVQNTIASLTASVKNPTLKAKISALQNRLLQGLKHANT